METVHTSLWAALVVRGRAVLGWPSERRYSRGRQTVPLGLRLPVGVAARLDAIARERGITRQALLEELIAAGAAAEKMCAQF